MIEVKYFAADIDIDKDPSKLYISFSNKADSEEPIGYYPLDELEFPIKRNERVDNYANFFGEGLDLYDDSIMLVNDEDHHIGYIPPYDARNSQDNDITITWRGTELPTLKNGLTIIFNKYVCKGVDVFAHYDQGGSVKIGSYYGNMGLPLKTHIPFELDANSQDELLSISFTLYDFFDNTPYNIQGIVLGKTIDIENIKSFDMLTEVNPISDDLSINETNITAIVDEDFNSNYGQKVMFFENGKMILDNVLSEITEDEITENQYEIKTRSKIDVLDKKTNIYPYILTTKFVDGSGELETTKNWGTFSVSFKDVINYLYYKGVNVAPVLTDDANYDDVVSEQISSILKPTTTRQLIQQVAWALGYMIDTTETNKINFIPFPSVKNITPDIIINNDDDRILKTSLKNGTVYSKILWYITKYEKKQETEDIGIITVSNKGFFQQDNCYIKSGELSIDEPFSVTYIRGAGGDTYLSECEFSPFYFKYIFKWEEPLSDGHRCALVGYRYSKNEEVNEIITGNSSGETLEIKNQILYPTQSNVMTRKMEQLKKWYAKNNTLTATVVDNNSEIKVGKIIKIQLKKGNYFQGVVTSVVRTNINDYHTVELEAHEWN